MTDSERLAKFEAALAAVLDGRTRIATETDAEIRRLLQDALRRIRQALSGPVSDYQAWYLPQLQRSIQGAVTVFMAGTEEALQSAADEFWDAGIDAVDKPLAAAGVSIAGLLPDVDTRQLRAMRAFMTDHMKGVTTTLANKINSELGMLVTGGQSQADTISRVAKLLDSGGRTRAITVLRTEVGTAFSIASQERKIAASEYLPGLKKLWRRSGKVHSRLSHDAADGQIRDVDQPFDVGGHQLMFPRDPAAPVGERVNCGCESLPHMDSWEVTNPRKMPFSDLEIGLSPAKANLAAGIPISQVLKPDVPLGTAVRQWEDARVGLAEEAAVAFDAQGRVLFEATGDAYSVAIPRGVNLRGATVTHTHPVVSSFSLQDVAFAANRDLAELRATDARYRYSLRPGKSGWGDWRNDLAPVAEAAEAQFMGRFVADVASGRIDEVAAAEQLYHRIWRLVARRQGLRYSRTSR